MNNKIVNGAVAYGAERILEEINFGRKDKEKITEFMQGIKEIEFEAIAKIRKMIEEGKKDE